MLHIKVYEANFIFKVWVADIELHWIGNRCISGTQTDITMASQQPRGLGPVGAGACLAAAAVRHGQPAPE